VDVCLSPGNIVYSPDAIYIAPGRAFSETEAVSIVPDLAVEIVSPSSRRMDLKTKRDDYEKFGVREYWVFEPDERRVRLYRLQGGVYAETICEGANAASEVIPGFAFDLAAVWESIQS
jgi:Uma2 family endonuclease